jgi:hypothetical protein
VKEKKKRRTLEIKRKKQEKMRESFETCKIERFGTLN